MEKMLLSLLSLVCFGSSQGIGAPASWHPVFRQTLPYIWKAGVQSLNPDNPNADNFAILDKLDDMKSKAGGYTFKMRWADPDNTETMHWKQTSNPFKDRKAGVVGYEPVKVTHTDNAWGGLEFDTSGHCLMDGSIGIQSWFYCVGYNGTDWGHGIATPSFGRPAKAVELFVMDPKTKSWVLMHRETLPHLNTEWVVNKDDPYNETYGIMDQLESYRNPADGKLELKLNWPDRYNTWHQDLNPVKASPPSPGPTVPGYKAINAQFTGAFWGGIEKNANQSQSVLDGSIGIATWFYAIGYTGINWSVKLIPAYQDQNTKAYVGSNNAELFVMADPTP